MDLAKNDSLFIESQAFKYEPLRRRHDIRILQLHPGSWDSPISCDMLAIDLDDFKPGQAYEAISYAWGDHADQKTILCNDKSFLVTKSLFEALQVFRHCHGNSQCSLWADNICINQADFGERNHQVQLMGRIYTQAAKVLIWLGHDDLVTVEAGFTLVCQVAGKHLRSHEAMRPRTSTSEGTMTTKPPCVWRAASSTGSLIKTPAQEDFALHELQALRSLFGCRWFHRLWALQEVALSRAADAFWGHGSVNFMLIGLTALHLLEYHRAAFIQHDPYYGMRKSWGMLKYWTNGWDAVNFVELLVVTRTLEASDPRDKVFGLLGLTASDSDPENWTFIDPDYSLTTAKVYIAVARKALVEQKDFNVLAAVQHGRHVPDDWVSWVPDWRTTSTDYLHKPGRMTSKDTTPVISMTSCPDCNLLSLGSTISVRGVAVDTVQDLDDDRFDVPNWLHADLPRQLQAVIHQYKDHYNEITLAFTLSGGYAFDGNLVDDTAAHIAEHKAFAEWNLERYLAGTSTIAAPSTTEDVTVSMAYRFYANCGPTVFCRRMSVTSNGMLGLGPLAIKKEDIIVILFGGTVPFLLRPYGDGKHYRLVAECYVYDVMDGLAVQKWRKDGEAAVDFHLY